jgi:hypothetical protein
VSCQWTHVDLAIHSIHDPAAVQASKGEEDSPSDSSGYTSQAPSEPCSGADENREQNIFPITWRVIGGGVMMSGQSTYTSRVLLLSMPTIWPPRGSLYALQRWCLSRWRRLFLCSPMGRFDRPLSCVLIVLTVTDPILMEQMKYERQLRQLLLIPRRHVPRTFRQRRCTSRQMGVPPSQNLYPIHTR